MTVANNPDKTPIDDLHGTIWGVTCFFNPANYKTKKQNYTKFRDGIKKQGLKLLTVECVFKNQKFSLNKKDADILIQRRASSVLWQKERLLNIGFENLPDDCDKVVFLDADIIFENENWVNETSELLNTYKVVQPYAKVLRLPKEGLPDRIFEPKQGYLEMEEQNSIAYNMFELDDIPALTNPVDYGDTGFAWALRREVLEGLGLYDRSIIGSGDRILGFSFYGIKDDIISSGKSIKMLEDLYNWFDRMYSRVKGSVSWTPGRILHLWHGLHDNRFYITRMKILSGLSFDPKIDLKIDSEECWQWASDNTKLHQEVEYYFRLRREDSSKISTYLKPFWRQSFTKELLVEALWNYHSRIPGRAFRLAFWGVLTAPFFEKIKFLRILIKIILGRNLSSRVVRLIRYFPISFLKN